MFVGNDLTKPRWKLFMSDPALPAQIAERIWLAIAERRLRPGTRLKEEELAEIFGVSRARIRQALSGLEREGLVKIVPNRGALVAAPTVEEAGDVLFARRTIEQRVVERLAGQIRHGEVAAGAVASLRDHVARERDAARLAIPADTIRLSGGFHLKLAELVGSDFLCSILRDLISRSSLITAIYRDSAHDNCGPDEHEAIIAALERGDAAAARDRMGKHLDHIEADLDLDRARRPEPNLRSVLGHVAPPPTKPLA
ncbi:MAG: GntR family transcriptional regulator [Paracoccus sp. (in: a-proteobacteria)]|nr:GntR family transcriptional regulator [Paracoccus sp. (in: a-proteobacteria)]